MTLNGNGKRRLTVSQTTRLLDMLGLLETGTPENLNRVIHQLAYYIVNEGYRSTTINGTVAHTSAMVASK